MNYKKVIAPIDLYLVEKKPKSKLQEKSDLFENTHRINIPKYGFVHSGIKIPANPISTLIDPDTILK